MAVKARSGWAGLALLITFPVGAYFQGNMADITGVQECDRRLHSWQVSRRVDTQQAPHWDSFAFSALDHRSHKSSSDSASALNGNKCTSQACASARDAQGPSGDHASTAVGYGDFSV